MKPRSLWIGIVALVLSQMACALVDAKINPGKLPESSPPPAPQATATTEGVVLTKPGSCQPPNDLNTQASGLVKSVTMAEGAGGENMEPLNPTDLFGIQAEIHAVVAIQDAPTDTLFKAVWYANDTFGKTECNAKIEETELTTEGTRNLDFSLSPKDAWVPGSFRVEIWVNGVLDQVANFKIQ